MKRHATGYMLTVQVVKNQDKITDCKEQIGNRTLFLFSDKDRITDSLIRGHEGEFDNKNDPDKWELSRRSSVKC